MPTPGPSAYHPQSDLRASFDEGRTWPQSRLIDAGASGYTCMARCGNKIGLLYERDGYKRITLWTLAWIH